MKDVKMKIYGMLGSRYVLYTVPGLLPADVMLLQSKLLNVRGAAAPTLLSNAIFDYNNNTIFTHVLIAYSDNVFSRQYKSCVEKKIC